MPPKSSSASSKGSSGKKGSKKGDVSAAPTLPSAVNTKKGGKGSTLSSSTTSLNTPTSPNLSASSTAAIPGKLKELKSVMTSLNALVAKHETDVLALPLEFVSTAPHPESGDSDDPILKFHPHLNQPFVAYEEALLALILKLDKIDSAGHALIKEGRRNVINQVQSHLRLLDEYKQAEQNATMQGRDPAIVVEAKRIYAAEMAAIAAKRSRSPSRRDASGKEITSSRQYTTTILYVCFLLILVLPILGGAFLELYKGKSKYR